MNVTTRFGQLVRGPDDWIPLDETALLIAAHAYPGLDIAAELRGLDELAIGCPEPSFEGWRDYLFGKLGFTGNVAEYYDPRNSFLNEVMRRRTGIPITLALLGIEVGRRLGVPLVGIGMPGHFLLRREGDASVFVDCFDGGRVLDELGCRALFHARFGPSIAFVPSYLEPVGRRVVLARMLANLRAIYTSRGDNAGLEWVLNLRRAIPGTPVAERRELAHTLAAIGRFSEAARELEALAPSLPDQAESLYLEARALRARLN
jgi:regulator of sirC expression with transglutaminase-like and TPR domain